MTNDIEGKVRRLLEELIDMVNQHCQVEFKEDGAILDTMALSSNESAIFLLEELGLAKEIINGRRYKLLDTKENIDRAILSLTTKPLDEKEVEKVLDEPIYSDKHTKMWVMARDKHLIAKLICSHFSKPVIKLPEKLPLNPNSTHCSQCGRDFYAFNNGYNKAISEMKRLNGEGGV